MSTEPAALPADMPKGITLRQDVSGVHLSFNRPLTMRDSIVDVLYILLWFPPFLGLGMFPVVIEPSSVAASWRIPATIGAMLLGVAIGIAASALVYRLLERVTMPLRTTVSILPHALTLGERTIPRSEVLFVNGGSSPEVVLRGGERVPIAPGSSAAIRSWLGRALQRAVAARTTGDASDIPEQLRALQQAQPAQQ